MSLTIVGLWDEEAQSSTWDGGDLFKSKESQVPGIGMKMIQERKLKQVALGNGA